MKGNIFTQNYKFSYKNHLLTTIIFTEPNFTIFRPKIVILGTDSLWTMKTKFDVLIYCVIIYGKKFNLVSYKEPPTNHQTALLSQQTPTKPYQTSFKPLINHIYNVLSHIIPDHFTAYEPLQKIFFASLSFHQ